MLVLSPATAPSVDGAVRRAELHVPQADLDDLQSRLARTRWPDAATVPGWDQGVPLDQAMHLVDHWRRHYDWRACEARLNAIGQYWTEVDGVGIHFLHARSPEPDALPVIMTHGWPGSVAEFLKVIDPLRDPRAHGGDPRDAVDVVVPSLPGFGFSERPRQGWPVERIASAWITLMKRLGYERFAAQGGDWGATVSAAIAATGDPAVAGIHLTMVNARPTDAEAADPTPRERDALAAMQAYATTEHGYSALQATRPQTLSYALTDSPVGQAMWIFEKFRQWSDCDGDPFSVFTPDELIDTIMLYWLPATAASSARLYWESWGKAPSITTDVPVACSVFPHDIVRPPQHWARRRFPNIVYWNEPARGGHFAALERPETFVAEVRAGLRPMR